MMKASVVCGLGILLCAGCGKEQPADKGEPAPAASGASPAPAPSAPAVAAPEVAAPAASAPTGMWSGSWAREKPVPGKGDMLLSIGEGGMGFVKVEGSACFPPGKETWAATTISGTSVKIEADGNGVKASYSGTVSGDEMTGTMTVSCAIGTGNGTWTLKKK